MRIGIVGGGASGLMAACFAAGPGCEVHLFEKHQKVGRKLQATGNGRCNISNSSLYQNRDAHYHGGSPGFVNELFERFGIKHTLAFFNDVGIPFKEEADGRLFPASLQASAVAAMFGYELKRRGIYLHLGSKVDRITANDMGFSIVTAGREEFHADAVILAAGSCAWPSLGGDEGGYRMAKALGHNIINPRPVILPLNLTQRIFHTIQGVKIDAALRVRVDGETAGEYKGELLFTAYGISGPAALAASRAVNEAIAEKRHLVLEGDFFPETSLDELRDLFKHIWRDESKKFSFSLIGVLNERLGRVCAKLTGIAPDIRVWEVPREARSSFAGFLKAVPLAAGAPRSFKEAVTAAGGVSTAEIDPATMESRLIKNLYVTGELLDIDGDSGGYNLQFAWSTGAVAGMSVNPQNKDMNPSTADISRQTA